MLSVIKPVFAKISPLLDGVTRHGYKVLRLRDKTIFCFRMAKSRFSREEMLQILKEDKILGEDVSQLVDMSFIKNPEKNPELIMDCYILALGQLGYRIG